MDVVQFCAERSLKQMNAKQICWSCIAAIVLLCFAAFVSKEWFDLYRRSHEVEKATQKIEERIKPIFAIHSAVPESNIVKQGGTLVVHFNISREEQCMSVTQRYLIDAKTGIVVWTVVSPSVVTSVGINQDGVSNIDIPVNIVPGDYIYRATIFNGECADGRSSAVPSPPIELTIVP